MRAWRDRLGRTRRRPGWLLVGLCLLLPAVPVLAGEDAGLRSVFALGAGNRALGMGGAYAAVAAGPSAPLWNPGGLALVPRAGVELTHTNLFGMGFSEQYLGAVWPDWRRGVFSLTIRRFGVDGIERRDDRNVLLDGDLDDSEMEIGLGFGRTLRPGLHAGAVLKLQSQSLAGYSGTAAGVDVGLLAMPWQLRDPDRPGGDRWTVGLAVRNLVEPDLRLDQEAVPDPRGWRLGTAYRRLLSPQLAALVSLDREQTRGMDARWHLGAEVRYRDLAALRLGSLDGTLTAGLGVAWHDLRIDFAFEDNVLGSIERLGITVWHGPSVAERRREAAEALERALRERLAEAYRESQRRQLADLLRQAREDLAAGRLDDVLSRTAMALVLAPDSREARSLQVTALRRRAEQQTARGDLVAATVTYGRLLQVAPEDSAARRALAAVREAGDRLARRSAALRSRFADALDAFARDDLATARRNLQEILAQQPGDSVAAAMLEKVDLAAVSRAEELARQAVALARAGDVSGAEDLLARAGRLAPAATGVQAARRELQRLRRAADRAGAPARQASQDSTSRRATVAAAPQRPALTPEQRREVAMLYEQGMQEHAAGRTDLALRHWELVWSLDPGYKDVREHLLNEYLTLGMEHFAAGHLEEAVAAWRKALQVDPQDRRARSYLERASSQLERIRSLGTGSP